MRWSWLPTFDFGRTEKAGYSSSGGSARENGPVDTSTATHSSNTKKCVGTGRIDIDSLLPTPTILNEPSQGQLESTAPVPAGSTADPKLCCQQLAANQPPSAMPQLTQQQNQTVKNDPQSEKDWKSLQAEVVQLKSQMQAVEACLAKHAPTGSSPTAQQVLIQKLQHGASAHLRCQGAVQSWHRTHLQETKDIDIWKQNAMQAEQQLKEERVQITHLITALQQNSSMQAKVDEGWVETVLGYFDNQSQQLHQVSDQHAQLQDVHRADQQKLNNTQQQLAMLQEHASQQVQQVKPVFNYLNDTVVLILQRWGSPSPELVSVADLTQDLKHCIKDLFMMLHNQRPLAIQGLLVSSIHPWQAVQHQMQQESRNSIKKRLQRDGFVYSVLLQLENTLWCTDIDEIFCFCLKQQIASNMHSARLSGDHTTQDDNPALPYIVSALEVYTKSCQYWLSESRKTSSAMDAMVEQRVLKLVKGLWPATTLEGWTGFPAELRNAFCTVVRAAVTLRLYVESCHPCYLLSVAGSVKAGELCSLPAVIVDSSLTLAGSGQTVRISAETC